MQAVAVLDYSQVYGRATRWEEVVAALAKLDPFKVFALATHWNALVQDARGTQQSSESIRIVRAIGESSQLRAIEEATRRIRTGGAWPHAFPPPIVHRQQLLIVMAQTLQAESWDENSAATTAGPELLDVLLAINEHLAPIAADPKRELFAQMLALSDFSNRRNAEAGLTRILRMVREIAPHVPTSVDVSELFRLASGLSLESYLSLTFAAAALTDVMSLGDGEQAPVDGDTVLSSIRPSQLVGESVTQEDAARFLDGLSLDRSTFAQSQAKAASPQTDFSVFRRAPMLKLSTVTDSGEPLYRLLDRTMLLQKLSDGPYWSTHEGARLAKRSIQDTNASWGHLFEEYCHRLIEHTPECVGQYTRNPRLIGSDPDKEDSDGLLVDGSALILLEFKFRPLPIPARSGVNTGVVLRAILERYACPDGAMQLARAVGEACRGRSFPHAPVERATALYPVLVAWDLALGAPMVNALLQRCFSTSLGLEDPRVRPLTVLTIEDLETILAHAGTVSVAALLDRCHAADPGMRFGPSWALEAELPGTGPNDHPWVRELAQSWREEMVVYMFPNGETARRRRAERADGDGS